jgi:hypothetical protein
MLSTICLLLAAPQLGPQHPLDRATLTYFGLPETPAAHGVRMQSHSATFQLTPDRLQLQTLTLFRNESDKEVTVELRIPVRGWNSTPEQVSQLRLEGTMDQFKLAITAALPAPSQPDRVYDRRSERIPYRGAYTFTATFRPKQTRALRMNAAGAQGRAGLDLLRRVVMYDTGGLEQWNGPVGQFNCAIQYHPDLVLQVFATRPERGWQVGTRGAFLRRTNVRKEEPLIFTYYPGGLKPIGTDEAVD